jgi:adenosyl cobinamide kinase/adenosyl cobinamide phosphate guanylyltransferase
MGIKFNVVNKMKEDFEWVCRVLSHKENRPEHFKSLKRLVALFKNKWDDDRREFKILYAFLKMFFEQNKIRVKIKQNEY